MRRAAKVDRNHGEIVEAFRDLGWRVLSLAAHGSGCPDLLCSKGGYQVLVECKDGMLPASKRQLTPDQEKFWQEWLGPLILVQSVSDVVSFDKKRFGKKP